MSTGTTAAEKAYVRQLLGGLVGTAVICTAAALFGASGGLITLIAVVLGIATLMAAHGEQQKLEKEAAAISAADQLLAESRALDQARAEQRRELLARLAGDMHTFLDRSPQLHADQQR